jgi:TRAP transporter TAXI family solute receptor
MVLAASAAAQELRFIRIGTGGIGGTYFPVGGLIANAISSPPGSMDCTFGGSCGVPGLVAAAVSTQGSVQNVLAMSRGALDMSLCQADIAHNAFTAKGNFSGKAPLANLRAIANLFPEQVHIVVRRDAAVRSVAGMQRKRISVGEPESGTLVTATTILKLFGLGLNDLRPVYDNIGRSSDILIEGKLDGLIMVAGYPVNAIEHAAENTAIALLPIAGDAALKAIERYPFFTPSVIPAGTYVGVPATETLAIGAQLLTRAQIDDNTVYAITRALWHPRNRKILDGGHPNGRLIRSETALQGLTIPLHPGAERYYVEIGLLAANGSVDERLRLPGPR